MSARDCWSELVANVSGTVKARALHRSACESLAADDRAALFASALPFAATDGIAAVRWNANRRPRPSALGSRAAPGRSPVAAKGGFRVRFYGRDVFCP